MISIFPQYSVSFHYDCTMQEAFSKISQAIEHTHHEIRMRQVYSDNVQNIGFTTHTNGYICFNSFMPMVNISMKDNYETTQITALFELQRGTKVLMGAFWIFAFVFELLLFALWMTNQLSLSIFILCPLCFIIFCYILSTVGLHFSSKKVLSILRNDITVNSAK